MNITSFVHAVIAKMQSHMDVESNHGAHTSSYRPDRDMPNTPLKKQYCDDDTYDLGDMPDFAAMIADFEGPDKNIAGCKELKSIRLDPETDLYPGCKKKHSS